MTNNNNNLISRSNALSLEIKYASSSTDITTGRMDCTRLLNQWKGMARQLTGEDCYAIISNSVNVTNESNDAAFVDGSIMSTLFSIVDNDNDFATEGHRETSLDALKGIIDAAFRTEEANKTRGRDEPIRLLSTVFQQCSNTFQKRMQRNSGCLDFHMSRGTSGAMESCEHIRLLLVELMLAVLSYLLHHTNEISEKDKLFFDTTSVVCQALSKSALSDPYPDVQRASCSLIERLAKFCPMAVRMNASSMLLPLTGHSSDQSISILKNCLFRHRHAKTRCKAVNASIATVLCCPSERSFHADECSEGDLSFIQSNQEELNSMQNTFSVGNGSKSTSVEQLLNDSVLPGWEELIKFDPSATVRMAVLEVLGKVASAFDWNLSPFNTHRSKDCNPAIITTFSSMDLVSVVETKVLHLFLIGLSDGNAQVKALAVQQLSSFREGTHDSLPWDILASFYQPLLELALDQCSSHEVLSCQARVRCLEALQVMFSLTDPLSNVCTTQTSETSEKYRVHVPDCTVVSVVNVLSNAILSDEKDVLVAALKNCRVIGGSDQLAGSTVSRLSELMRDQAAECGGDESGPTSDSVTAVASPRQIASSLLFVDGLLKGYLSNHKMTSVLQEMHSSLPVTVPSWFSRSDATTTICHILACTSVTKNVVINSSLAWSLLDACSSFVQCAIESNEERACTLTKENIVDVLTSITYLLGCPDEYGVSNHALNVLDAISSSKHRTQSTEFNDEPSGSILDDYFRQVSMKISSSAPFPWKRLTPAFLAIDALLRNTKGSTVRINFDLVASLFLYHLPENKENATLTQGVGSTSLDTKQELAEEYSLRIALMAMLQAILSDGSFSETVASQSSNDAMGSASSRLSSQFTFDVLLSLVLPNLVWKSGALAAALRKLSIATLFALLTHQGMTSMKLSGIDRETYSYLLPMLHSNLEDTESTTRELSCVCLSLIFSRMPCDIFQDLWSNETRVVDTLYPRLLALLDDSHNPVRLAACVSLERLLTVTFNSSSLSRSAACSLELSTLDNITESLVLAMDDPDCDIQTQALHVLLVLIDLVQKNHYVRALAMIEKHAKNGAKSHRDGEHCHILLQKLHLT